MSGHVSQPEWWMMDEFADYMRVTPRAARAMINRDQVPRHAVMRVGRRIRIRVAVIKQWMEKGVA